MSALTLTFAWVIVSLPAQEPQLLELLRLPVAETGVEVRVSPDGSRLAAGGAPLARVRALAFSRDGQHIAVAMAGTNGFVDVARGTVGYARSPEADRGAFAVAPGLTGPEALLVDAGGVGLWNIGAGARIRRFTTVDVGEAKRNAALSPDGRTLVLGDGFGGQGATLVNLLTGNATDAAWDVNDLSWSASGWLVTVSGDSSSCIVTPGHTPPPRSVRVLDAAGELRIDVPVSFPDLMTSSEPGTAAFVPGEPTVLVGSYRGVVAVDIESGTTTVVTGENCRWLRFLDRERLITTDFRTLTVRRYPSLESLDTFSLGDYINHAQLSPDARRLAFVTGGYLVVLALG